jgi:hypothetical protein
MGGIQGGPQQSRKSKNNKAAQNKHDGECNNSVCSSVQIRRAFTPISKGPSTITRFVRIAIFSCRQVLIVAISGAPIARAIPGCQGLVLDKHGFVASPPQSSDVDYRGD